MVFRGLLLLSLFVCVHVALVGDTERQDRDWSTKAVAAADSGNFEEARRVGLKAAQILLSEGRPTEAGRTLVTAGEIAQVQENFSLAESLYGKGIDLLRGAAASHDLELTVALDDLGWMYVTWGRLADGSRLMDEASAQAQGAPPNDSRLIHHFDIWAAYLMVMGRYSEAKRTWKKALNTRETSFGPNSQPYAEILVHFGQSSALYGAYAAAEQLLLTYLSIPGGDQPVTRSCRAAAEAELGHIDLLRNKLSEAETWFTRASGTLTSQPEPLVHSIVSSYLGDFYMRTRKWERARQQYQKTVELLQGVLGDSHAVAGSMLSLSKALHKLHLRDEERSYTARAKSILAAYTSPRDRTIDVMALRHQ